MKICHNLKSCVCDAFATFLFLGYLPWCPGTITSAVSALIIFYLPEFSVFNTTFLWLFIFVFGLLSTENVLFRRGGNDPSFIVIDEVMGMSVALLGLPKIWSMYFVAFLLFRFFDIVKPFPIGFIERKLPGEWGVILDDVAAGVATSFLIKVIYFCV
jgi:phosphatidylglycerophosphatase A